MKVLDLFSGIGGFSLGLERAGFQTVAFCEIDPYCRKVLAKHWPEVPIYNDIRHLGRERLAADGIVPDVLCGGFPCQDISCAGKGAGIDGERSGLWSEYARLIGELRPRYAIVENVSSLLHRGLDRVLGDLAALGYDAEWHCIPASAVGAPHRRDRIWIIASRMGNAASARCNWGAERSQCVEEGLALLGSRGAAVGNAIGMREPQSQGGEQDQWGRAGDAGWWRIEPDLGRVAHGVPARVDRLKGLGNAVVPQVVELIGKAILDAEQISKTAPVHERRGPLAGVC